MKIEAYLRSFLSIILKKAKNMNAKEINFNAYKYAESIAPLLSELCSPLFTMNIKVFAYFRFFNNGKYLYLCNNLKWVEFCLQNVHSNEGTSLGKEIGRASKDDYHCFLWPTVKSDYLLSALYDFNIWNGLSIFKQRDDSIELWGVAADRQTDNMQNFYIENIALLKDFTASFNLNAFEFIKPASASLAVYKDFKPSNKLDEYDHAKINEFIKATKINKKPIITTKGEIFLSTKELECLNLLASGKNVKQIASYTFASERTIEKHFENIKRKIGEDKKESIIKVYKESVLNWL